MTRTVKTARVTILERVDGQNVESTFTSFNTDEKKIAKELKNCGRKALILDIEIVPVVYVLDDTIFFEYAVPQTEEATEEATEETKGE